MALGEMIKDVEIRPHTISLRQTLNDSHRNNGHLSHGLWCIFPNSRGTFRDLEMTKGALGVGVKVPRQEKWRSHISKG